MSNHRILMVDDERAIREMIRVGLELEGFICLEAVARFEDELALKVAQEDKSVDREYGTACVAW